MRKTKTFVQTKLNFGAAKPAAVTTFENNTSIEEQVSRLKLGSKQPNISPTSSSKVNTSGVTSTAAKVDELSSDGTNKSTATPVQFGKPTQSALPPAFSWISLVYSEEEIWTRLNIREFIYQFGKVCQLEPRLISSLQNVQGDWRIRRLSATLVWHGLLMIGNFSISDNNNNNSNSTINPEIQRLTRQIVNDWSSSFGLSRTAIPNTKERLERTGELLSKKGMTGEKWQQVAELLVKADFKNLPIPTSNLIESMDVEMNDIETSTMDFENEHDTIDYQIQKFRSLKRSPLSTQEELYMVEMLFDIVLMDGRIRQQIMDSTKHLKAMKDFKMALDLQRHQLNTSRQMDTYINGDQEESRTTAIELDKQEIEAMATTMRSDNRLQRLITPWDENEYWIFHDLLSPQQHLEGKSMESYWAHGVILIGKCPTLEDVGETTDDKQQQQRGWWYLYGIKDIRKLDNWLASCLSIQKSKGTIEKSTLDITGNDIKLFRTHLGRRIEYLKLLERAIYGNGYFS